MNILTRKICGIYKITNTITGMIYVGQSKDITKRWKEHRLNYQRDHNHYLSNAIKKYGIENFSFEIVKRCSLGKLDEFERKYISLFNSLRPNGYNIETGGNSQKSLADETKNKISLSKYLFYQTKMGKKAIRKAAIVNSKPINQYQLNGKYIRTFESMAAANIYLGKNKDNGTISKCAHRKIRKAFEYQWRFCDNTNDIEPIRDKKIDKMIHKGKDHPLFGFHRSGKVKKAVSDANSIPVNQYTRDGKFIRTFKSATEASMVLIGKVGGRGHIGKCCKGKMKTAYGYIWRYAK